MDSFYTEWGFSGDPFETTELLPDQMGEDLLVCRSVELDRLSKALNKSTKWICLDGGIGQGKTSLANVAIFKQMKNYLTTGAGRFLIPCRNSIQITRESDPSEVRKDILRSIARTLIAKDSSGNSEILKYCQLDDKAGISKLFSQPFFSNNGITLGPVGASSGSAPNSTDFYAETLYETIESWLEELDSANGAVVCIIDNLELVGTASTQVAAKLEELRDTLLTKRGIIWILCGANGSVQGMASTRINAHLKKPAIKIGPVSNIKEVVSTRINYFGKGAYFPLSNADLSVLDKLMSHILRECIGYIGNYCDWVYSNDHHPITEDEKKECFKLWLDEMNREVIESYPDLKNIKAWSILKKAFHMECFTLSQHNDFWYSASTNFSTDANMLVGYGLLTRSKSDIEGSNIQFALTPKARLAMYKEVVLSISDDQ